MISRREALSGAGVLFLVINAIFAPFLWGDRSMMSSSLDSASIYEQGASPGAPVRSGGLKELDPGAAAWQTEPVFALEHRLLAQGSAPLWNPYVGFGQPLAANMQSQPFSPMAWIVEAHPSIRAYNAYVALRFWVAALFAFLFLGFYVRLWPALGGGIAYAFTGYLVLYYDMPELSVEVLLPALLWAIERLVRRPGPNAVGVLALVVAATVFGGMPESAFLAFFFAAAYGLVRALADPLTRRQALKIAGLGASATALGALSSSVLTLPFLEFLQRSLSQHAATAGAGLAADIWDFRLAAIYLAPLIGGPPWNDIFHGFSGHTGIRGYWGVAAAYLALVAVWSRIADLTRDRPVPWTPELFFASAAVLLLLKRFGWPLVNALGALPGFVQIYFVKYEEALIGISVAALAAFGIERLATRRAGRIAPIAAALIILTLLTFDAAIVEPAVLALARHGEYFGNALVWALFVFAVVVGLGWWAQRSEARFVGLAATLLVTVDLFGCYLVPMWYIVNEPPPMALNPLVGAAYVAYVQRETGRTHERFLGLDYLLYPEWSSAFGITDVRDLNALYARDYLPFVRTFFPDQGATTEIRDRFSGSTITHLDDRLSRRFLALSSVRFVAAPPGTAIRFDAPSGERLSPFSVAAQTPGARILRFASPLPRVALYARVVRAADVDRALTTLAAPDHDVRRVAVVTVNGPDAAAIVGDLAAGPDVQAGAGTLERYESDDVVAAVDARTRVLAVLNDTDYPGWRATVDGRAVPIVRANALFRGVEVEPGRHTIEFRYRPRSFEIGFWLTLAGLGIALALALSELRPRSAGT